MDQQFSSQTKELIAKSREVALELRTPYISSFHFFLADCILFDQQSALRFVFESTEHFKKYYADYKAAQEVNVPHFKAIDVLPLTLEAERIIKATSKDQLQHKHPEIMPFHVMLAAVRQPDSELLALLHPKENLYSKLEHFYTRLGLLNEKPSSVVNRVKDFFSASENKADINTELVSIDVPKNTNTAPPIFENVVRDKDDKVEMTLTGLAEGKNPNTYAVILVEKNGARKVPIIVGTFEAQSLSVAIEKMTISRPLIHHLFQQTILSMGYTLKESFIHSMTDGIFHASITLTKDDHLIEQEARPSDAMTLATMFNVPIYFSSKMLEQVKVEG